MGFHQINHTREIAVDHTHLQRLDVGRFRGNALLYWLKRQSNVASIEVDADRNVLKISGTQAAAAAAQCLLFRVLFNEQPPKVVAWARGIIRAAGGTMAVTGLARALIEDNVAKYKIIRGKLGKECHHHLWWEDVCTHQIVGANKKLKTNKKRAKRTTQRLSRWADSAASALPRAVSVQEYPWHVYGERDRFDNVPLHGAERAVRTIFVRRQDSGLVPRPPVLHCAAAGAED
jgi:hypothetical protein